jgi:polysaccharide export outer membrane protein
VSVKQAAAVALLALLLWAAGCGTSYPPLKDSGGEVNAPYLIGAGDTLNISVWRNPDLSASLPVRPDGRITVPLAEDMQASGKTPTQLARDIEKVLAKYIQNPVVSVTVTGFVGLYSQQIRVIGEATKPQALPYRENMTLLDVMAVVGGITDFADGDKASILRTVDGKSQQFRVRLTSLLKRGDLSANVQMRPGDVLVIPQSLF